MLSYPDIVCVGCGGYDELPRIAKNSHHDYRNLPRKMACSTHHDCRNLPGKVVAFVMWQDTAIGALVVVYVIVGRKGRGEG